mgnify:CR=1 FL=1
MAKKVSSSLLATLIKNPEKGGAWLAQVALKDEGMDNPYKVETTAWSNASAGKRWVKARTIVLTPKKNCKMISNGQLDAKGKPISFVGQIGFKREI